MEAALYLQGHGYYARKDRRIFGREGDFYTAAQVQPLFGLLIAKIAEPHPGVFLDWGAGGAHMRPFFSEYIAADVREELPQRFSGFVFANELFDALPVDVFCDGQERRVTVRGGRFDWDEPLRGEIRESAPGMKPMIENLSGRLAKGALLAIDYGYTKEERRRFPRGTLMSYREHRASEDVFDSPGERDITAHVDFDALREAALSCGFREERFTSLQRLMLDAAEGMPEAALLQHRMHWKTLLAGMGETFRALLWTKG